MFYFVIVDGVKIGKFRNFDKYAVKHGISTRIGGVSNGEYSSLNLGISVGDDRDNVISNRRALCEALAIDAECLTVCNQVHGDRIIEITKEKCGCGINIDINAETADAMLTNTGNVALQCGFADCVPILLYAPDKAVAAVAHAGWKGTVAGIAAKTVRLMTDNYNCDPSRIVAGIGPSIGQCCFEVDKLVADCFYERFKTSSHLLISKRLEKYNIDLWLANKLQLLDVGLLEENISCAGLCTSCNTDLFYSYRKENGKTGRHAAIIAL
ncbi:MAG: peptidoglycan editing factor PgeF [Bacillota bacterium]